MESRSSISMASDGSVITPSARHPVTPPPGHSTTRSSAHGLRAWCYLVWLCVLRLARLRQMVGIAVGLLVLMASVVGLTTYAGRAGMEAWQWRWPPPPHPTIMRLTFEQTVQGMS